MNSDPIHREEFTVPPEAVDGNGHVNNVVWVQWMQDVAIRHAESVGGNQAMRDAKASWVVRAHRVEYLSPAFAGDRIAIATWVVDFRRIRSLRRYQFSNAATGKVLVTGETDWVFIDRETGRPRAIPDDVSRCFPLLPDEPAQGQKPRPGTRN
jgi:acyl-CoA thioester hydrolase